MDSIARRGTWLEVDTKAIEKNAAILKDICSESELCAVVKANGYGHGIIETAQAAVAGGATWLAVATLDEGECLKNAGFKVPVLLLSEPPENAAIDVVQLGLIPTVYTEKFAQRLGMAAERANRLVEVHIKIDTGMHRVGCEPNKFDQLYHAIESSVWLKTTGAFTHFACSDEPDNPLTALQLELFKNTIGNRKLFLHASNSAGALFHPNARLDMVRIGIALYGARCSFDSQIPEGIIQAASLRARVGFIRHVVAGEGVSYGHKYRTTTDSRLAVLPVGYNDGLHRCYSSGEVLIRGRRFPIAGTITMDQVVVDLGGDQEVEVGDIATIFGDDGNEFIALNEIAHACGTIDYEVLTNIGPRVPRKYV